MADHDQMIRGLREALVLSPNNLPLRQHLAEFLSGLGRYEEAELEFKQAIAAFPDSHDLKLGLATTFFLQGKNSAGMVIVEELLKQPQPPAKALLLHARLCDRAGEVERAVRQYRRAVDLDPTLADAEFAGRLGIVRDGSPDEQTEVIDGKVRASTVSSADEDEPEIERPTAGFKDVGGMEAVKEEIRMKIIHPMTRPELYKAYGKKIGGGLLMYGPPGCGKTHLARATAGEIKASFISVGLHEILDMWIGSSERNLHKVFEHARQSRPCVLFFDEVDALAASRADARWAGSRQIINQFLAELDGLDASNEGVLILAATNAPWHLDGAFRRPGRFDRVLFVPPPDGPARAAILRIHLAGKPVEVIDHEHVAKKTEGFSGADLKWVVDTAVEGRLREAMELGKPVPITTKDLLKAAASGKASTKDWFASARNYALYSNQGGTYDEILKYLKL